MENLDFGRYAFGICMAATMLAGCAGSQLPIGAPGTMPQSSAIASQAAHGGSWMLSEAKGEDLLYVSDFVSGKAYVLSYPAGKLEGTLSGFDTPEGECVDAAGDVWITASPAEIVEYAHGGTKPIDTLKNSHNPIACAVDPGTGNLAVAGEDGTVSIYQNATGEPTIYSVPLIPSFCAYDDGGNLFVDSSGAPAIRIAKLPRGGDAFEMVAYEKRNNGDPAGLQWVGKRLQVGSASPYSDGCCGRIIHVVIKGIHGRRAGKLVVRGALVDFFIEGSTAIVTTNAQRIAFYDYPQGGHATKIIKEPGYSFSVVVSDASPGTSHQRWRRGVRGTEE
jgi:hypothetical protein